MSDLITTTSSFHQSPTPHDQRQPFRSNTSRGAFSSIQGLIRHPARAISGLLDSRGLLSPKGQELEPNLADVPRHDLLRLKLLHAYTLDDWNAAAVELDAIEGNNDWKSEASSTEYDYQLVQSRLQRLDEARKSHDAPFMLFLIRTSLTRYLGGMGNTSLYTHSRIGTKYIIERYIASAVETLNSLLDITRHRSDLDARDVLQQVLKARQSFGRSALLFSGGGTFGMNHIGVAKCLWQHKLLPRIISGASAGSIVCAVLCTRTDDEIPEMLKDFCNGDLQVFTRADVDDSVMQRVASFLKSGALFDIANLTRIMKELVGDMTFQEAYNRTRRILNICVSSASLFELPRLLNYVTAPNVLIWSAVAASCSVPLIYSPAGLLAKDPKTGKPVPWNLTPQGWIDGSVENDLPMTRLAEMFNVNHFIVSQVNPHVVPFLAKEEGEFALQSPHVEAAIDTGPSWVNVLANLAKDEVMHRMHVLSELGMFSTLLTKTRSVLSQKYSGDITIFPEISYSQFPNVLRNPTKDFMLQASLSGERATWSKLSRIQNHCAIELALDDAVQQLRARIAFSPSQVDLRMNGMMRPASRAGSEHSRTSHVGAIHKHGRKVMVDTQRTRRSFSSSESDSQRHDLPTRRVFQSQQPQLRLRATSAHVSKPEDEWEYSVGDDVNMKPVPLFLSLELPRNDGDGRAFDEFGRGSGVSKATLPQLMAGSVSPLTEAPLTFGSPKDLHAIAASRVAGGRRRSLSTGLKWLKPSDTKP